MIQLTKIAIGPANDLALKRRQTITGTNDGIFVDPRVAGPPRILFESH